MLDQNDLQAIASLLQQQKEELSELMDTKIAAAIDASEERMKAYIDKKVVVDMKGYIDDKVTNETNRSIAYTESVVEAKLDAIKEGLDLALETRIPIERIERIEENITVLKNVVRIHSEEIEKLKRAQ